jgi:PAS domain S-box-containing protein
MRDLWHIWNEHAGLLLGALPGPLGALFQRLSTAMVSGSGGDVDSAFQEWAISSARSRVNVVAWSDSVETVRRHLLPALILAYRAEPERLEGALRAMQRTTDRALVELTQEYLSYKRRLLDEQRKETDQAVLRFDRLAESGILGVIVCDLAGHIRQANDGFLALVGYSREELLAGKLCSTEMTPPEWRQADQDAADQLAVYGKTRPWEKEFICKDGSRVPILIGVAMTRPDECVAFVLDVTERKQLDELRARSLELESQNRRILEANRLKSEFLANMSHELRTPLNSIIGFADLLHDGEVSPDSPQHREFLGDILESGRHLLKLINDVLDLARVEAGKLELRPESIDLRKATAEVGNVFRATAADKSIRIKFEIDPELDQVTVDPFRLKQVLYNYTSNALKFTPEGGTVVIRALPAGPEAFRLEVVDNGIGIAASDLGRLFVEFEQLDASTAKKHAGTGLGLALTKRIVEAQDGSVGVKSTLGEGSLFFAMLPRHAIAGNDKEERPASIPGRRPGAAVVLVVEDDLRDQALLIQALRNEGFAVDVVATGLEAISSCEERAFDAITLDLLLPDITGLEVLRRVRSAGKNRETPVVIVSVVAEQGVVGGFPVHDYMRKPVNGVELIASLGRAGLTADRRENF